MPRLRSIAKWITILTVGIPIGFVAREFWDHGVFLAVLIAAKSVVLSLWNMLCDFAAACSQFLHFVFGQRA
jgi:hypothetical protein